MTAHAHWKPTKLDKLGSVGRGKSRHRPRNADFLYGGPYPFFQTGDIKAAQFHLSEYSQTYSADGLAQSKLWRAGTLCITIAANIAESAILSVDGCFPDSVVGFVPDPAKADVRFIKYYMDTLKVKMQSVSRGTTQDNLSLDKLLTFDFLVPSLADQRRIAGVLAAYDELIENSQRRIRVLETMAKSLYREWFINFRFPGHESVPRVPSAMGKIPDGWKVKKVAEVAQAFRGCSYRSIDLAEEGGLPFLNLKCLDRDGGFRRSGLKRYTGKYKELHIARSGDIVMAVTDMTQDRRIVARAALVPTLDRDMGVLSMDLVRIEPRAPVSKPYLYSFLRYSGFADEVKQHANGVNVLHLAPERITDFRFVVPATDVMKRFTDFYAPTLGQIDALENKIANLRLTRDLLLPRIMSGQVNFQAA